jgi:hypothetical protein
VLSDTLLRHKRSHSATRRNKSAKKIINARSVGVVSPTSQNSGELPDASRPDITESTLTPMDDGRAANSYDALEFSHGEDVSGNTYPSTNAFNQGTLPMDTSNSTLSPSFGLQPRSYTSESLDSGKPSLLTSNQDF